MLEYEPGHQVLNIEIQKWSYLEKEKGYVFISFANRKNKEP